MRQDKIASREQHVIYLPLLANFLQLFALGRPPFWLDADAIGDLATDMVYQSL